MLPYSNNYYAQKLWMKCWRDDLGAVSTGCASKGPSFDLGPYTGTSQLSATALPGDSTPPYGLHKHCMRMVYRHKVQAKQSYT